jgi:uncharacterized protein YggE
MPFRISLGPPALAALVASALLVSTASTASADTSATPDTSASPATLTVESAGQANVIPDLASLTITINRSATTARGALSEANVRADLITRAVRALGVPSSGIQTQSVSVSNTSHRTGPKNNRHLIRQFTATESLYVTSVASLAGDVIDAATHNGASSVNGLSFSFSNSAAGQIAANNAALANAQQQANAAAAALGYTVTGVRSVDLNPQSGVASSGTSLPAPGSVPTGAGTPTTVHPGVEQVNAEVEVVYTITPTSP